MIFSSYIFVRFLAVVFCAYFALNHFNQKKGAKVWLVLASFYFYAQGSLSFVPYFIFTVFFNFLIGTALVKAHSTPVRKILFFLGLAENLVLLGYFKYIGFFTENINAIAQTHYSIPKVALPIGISFFTFQLIAFLVDCYRKETKEYSLINYLLFITFFPQLIVGPIVHHADIVPQFEAPLTSKLNLDNIMLGLFVFAIGCTKKLMIADPLTEYAQSYFDAVASGTQLTALLSALSYTFSYYFDLSGYADMAIGLGLFFNIHLPHNFNSPYRTRNFRDYWRAWHMSLSKFLSDYIFKSIYKKGTGAFNFYFAVMSTFVVSGFWHGAGWRFVLWGAINGIFVCLAHFMARKQWTLPTLLAYALTFTGVVATRIIFVSNSLQDAMIVFRKILGFSESEVLTISEHIALIHKYVFQNSYIIATLIAAMVIAFTFKNTRQWMALFKPSAKFAFITGALIVLSLFQMSSVAKFLYFQF